jgi:hypothetical protein
LTDTLQHVIAENTLLTNTHPWYINGWVYLGNEATLHIEPGAVVKIIPEKQQGGGLVITRGAKLIARGLSNQPIRFELNDTVNNCSTGWTGLILLGKAPQQQPYKVLENVATLPNSGGLAYGGKDLADSSGILQHVWIAGMSCNDPAIKGRLPAGLLLLGTGSRTVIKDVMIQPLGEKPFYLKRTKLP